MSAAAVVHDEDHRNMHLQNSAPILQAILGDAEAIPDLQSVAYISEAELYKDFEIPPLGQTIEDLKATYRAHIFLKAVIGDRIVGSVRAEIRSGTCRIGPLDCPSGFPTTGDGHGTDEQD